MLLACFDYFLVVWVVCLVCDLCAYEFGLSVVVDLGCLIVNSVVYSDIALLAV